MSCDCIIIASLGECFDSIVVNGENGFLCKVGDTYELVPIFKRIDELTKEEKHTIFWKASETTFSLTDDKAAKRYIDDLDKLTLFKIINMQVAMNHQFTTFLWAITNPQSINAFVNGSECLTCRRVAA